MGLRIDIVAHRAYQTLKDLEMSDRLTEIHSGWGSRVSSIKLPCIRGASNAEPLPTVGRGVTEIGKSSFGSRIVALESHTATNAFESRAIQLA
jgi:hypothetical protein